jgi:hypothetical protein
MFGKQQLREILVAGASEPAEQRHQALVASVHAFQAAPRTNNTQGIINTL